ncbi:MAG: flagellar biosynthetic protein FliO [Myxococcales bacterium]
MAGLLRVAAACLVLVAALPAGAAGQEGPGSVAQPAAAEVNRPASPGGDPSASGSLDLSRPADAARAGPDDLDDRPQWAEPGTGVSLLGSLVRMLVVLAVVVAIIYLTLNFGLRRLVQVPGRASVVTVHERIALEPKKSVYVVEAAGEYLLVGVGEGEVNLLGQLDKARVEEALARKQQAAASLARPFWERLTIKPAPRKPRDGDPS